MEKQILIRTNITYEVHLTWWSSTSSDNNIVFAELKILRLSHKRQLSFIRTSFQAHFYWQFIYKELVLMTCEIVDHKMTALLLYWIYFVKSIAL